MRQVQRLKRTAAGLSKPAGLPPASLPPGPPSSAFGSTSEPDVLQAAHHLVSLQARQADSPHGQPSAPVGPLVNTEAGVWAVGGDADVARAAGVGQPSCAAGVAKAAPTTADAAARGGEVREASEQGAEAGQEEHASHKRCRPADTVADADALGAGGAEGGGGGGGILAFMLAQFRRVHAAELPSSSSSSGGDHATQEQPSSSRSYSLSMQHVQQQQPSQQQLQQQQLQQQQQQQQQQLQVQQQQHLMYVQQEQQQQQHLMYVQQLQLQQLQQQQLQSQGFQFQQLQHQYEHEHQHEHQYQQPQLLTQGTMQPQDEEAAAASRAPPGSIDHAQTNTKLTPEQALQMALDGIQRAHSNSREANGSHVDPEVYGTHTDAEVLEAVHTLATALGASRIEVGTIKALHAVLLQLLRPEMSNTEACAFTTASSSNFNKWRTRVFAAQLVPSWQAQSLSWQQLPLRQKQLERVQKHQQREQERGQEQVQGLQERFQLQQH